MSESLKITVDLPVSPERVYRAWLDSYEHSQYTGSPAKIDPTPGGAFTAEDGYVRGRTLVATPFSHIVQAWRTRDFPPGSADSRLDIRFEATCLGSQVTLEQTSIPAGQSRKTMDFWEDRLFRPMLQYFEKQLGDEPVDIDG